MTVFGNEEDRTRLEKDFELNPPTESFPLPPSDSDSGSDKNGDAAGTSDSPFRKISSFFQNMNSNHNNHNNHNNENIKSMDSGTEKKKGNPILNFIMNLLWLILGGLIGTISLLLEGLFFCITIIGIPFGIQLFKIATLYLSPFGADVMYKQDRQVGCLSTGMNIIWIIFFGLIMAIANFLAGLILCITIIGIPFGLQYFKLGKIMFAPFGIEVVRKDSLLIPICIAVVLAILLLIFL